MGKIVINIEHGESGRRVSDRICQLLCWYAFIGGVISLSGWVFDLPRLTDWTGIGVSIQPNATIAVISASAAVFLLSIGFHRIALVLGILVTTIGLTALFQIVTEIDLGINTLLLFGREWGRVGVISPGRMGTPGAISWTLIGFSVLLPAVGPSLGVERPMKDKSISAGFGLATLTIATLSLTGYLYGAEQLYTIPRLTVIALQTATFIFAISIALLAALNDAGPMRLLGEASATGLMVRRIVPAIIIIPVALGVLRLAGERAGLYDLAFGTAGRTIIEIVLLVALLWWTARTVSGQERLAHLHMSIARQRELELQDMADAMPQVVWIANANGDVHYFNRRVEELGGREGTDADLDRWSPTIHQDDVHSTARAWAKAVAGNHVYAHEHRVLMADGSFRWHLSRAVPISNDSGVTEKWYGTATDIHDVKEADEIVRKAEERLRLAVEAGNLGVWETYPHSERLFWDDRTRELFGVGTDREITYDGTIWKVIPKEEHAIVRVALKNAFDPRGDGKYDVEHRIVLDDGSIRWLHNLGRVEFGGLNGERKAVVMRGTVADVTARKEEESRVAFLARLGDIIRDENDPEALLYSVAKAIGTSFKATRCMFAEVDLEHETTTVHRDFCTGVSSMAGKYPLSEYNYAAIEEMRSGKTVINIDTKKDERTSSLYASHYKSLGERAYVSVPLMRGGQWIATLRVIDSRPRAWSRSEVRVIESVGERTWLAVEKLRADIELKELAALLSLATQIGDYGMWDLDYASGDMIWSEQLFRIFGAKPNADRRMSKADHESLIHASDLDNVQRADIDARENKVDFSAEYRIRRADNGETRWVNAAAQYFYDPDGLPTRSVGVAQDISERKLAEERLRAAYDDLEARVADRTTELAASNAALMKQMQERESAEREKIELLGRLVSSQEVERRRIARDIHDQLGQRLTALRLKIASLREAAAPYHELSPRVQRLQEIGEKLDTEVSFLAWELRPSALDDLGFVEAIGEYVIEWSKHSEVPADFHASELSGVRLDQEVETHLYRITQEGLNNIAKHSQAKHVTVLLEKRGESIILIIEDNGKGFDVTALRHSPDSGGLGLVGMRERAGLAGGEIEVESSPGAGTTLYVRVPHVLTNDG